MPEPVPQAGGSRGPARLVWRTLASVRLGVALLGILAAACTVGVVLPQPESFNAGSYVARRLDPRSEHVVRPAEFVALARAAGTLGANDTWAALAKQIDGDKLDAEAWTGFLTVFARRAQRDEMSESCLRLAYVDSYGTFLGRVLLFLRAHGLFTSAWFRLLCALLILNLAACSAERLPSQWRRAFRWSATEDPAWYRRRATHAQVVLPTGAAREPRRAAELVERALWSQGFRVERRGSGLSGTRGWLGALGSLWRPLGRLAGLGRLGSQVVHLGIVLIVIGGFISGQLSFRHAQLVARGEVVAVPDVSYRLSVGYQLQQVGYGLRRLIGGVAAPRMTPAEAAAKAPDWREAPGQPPRDAAFRMQLRRFEFRADPRGKPEYFGSYISLLDTQPPTELVIEVNHPLVYRGFHVYQQSYQPDYRGITSVSFLALKVGRPEGAPAASHGDEAPIELLQQLSLAVPPDVTLTVPGTDLTLRVLRYFPHWQIPLEQAPDGTIIAGEARNLSDEPVNPAIQVRLEAPGHAPRDRWIPLPFRAGEPRPGGVIDYADYRIVPMDFAPEYATWLTFKTHPVMLPVWLGCAVVMLGVVLCFYCNHERIWALVRPLDDGRCELLLAGDAFKWRERFRERFNAVVAACGPGSNR